jgi:antitoxin component of RelBE/YafQ-DinJ toxin-antitoxin module
VYPTVWKELGLAATQAITLFTKQVALERGLRFAVRVPNDVTNLSGEDKQVLLSLVEEYRHLP